MSSSSNGKKKKKFDVGACIDSIQTRGIQEIFKNDVKQRDGVQKSSKSFEISADMKYNSGGASRSKSKSKTGALQRGKLKG